MKEKQNNAKKLTDKAFSRLIALSVLCILVSLTCLCSTTWAWYNTNTTSGESSVESGVFDVDVSVINANGEIITVTKNANRKSACTFGAAGEYTVTLSVSVDATVTSGFCLVTIGEKVYATDLVTSEAPVSFTVTIADSEVGSNVIFTPNWGIPATPDVVSGVLQRGF